MVILHLCQETLDLLVVLINQFRDLLPKSFIEYVYLLEVRLDQRLFRLPYRLELILDLSDQFDICFGMLMQISSLAACTQKEVLFAIFSEAEMGYVLVMDLANSDTH
jgi:hypothetical protein